VGDAAFAPDPLSGTGLEWAVESAQLGAEAILQAIQECASGKFAQYEDLIRTRVSRHEQAAEHYYRNI
jgi:flavin-dependent dehydrogenase